MQNERKKVWIDQFQTRLTIRIALYLVIYLVCLGNLLFIWKLLEEGPGNPFEQFLSIYIEYAPALIFLVVLLPVMAWDAIRFSHRLVGPLVRFRRTMQDIANGQPVRPIKLRDGDFLDDLRDDFNRMLETLQRQGLPVIKPADGNEQAKEQQRQPA